MDILPRQPQDFTHSQRTRKGKIHCDVQFAVLALIQCLANGICIPNVTLFINSFRQDGVVERIFSDQFPTDSLLKGTAKKFENSLDGRVRNIFCVCLAILSGGTGRFLECLNVFIHYAGCDRLHFQIADNGVDVVGNQGKLSVIHRDAPLSFAIGSNKVMQKFPNSLLVWG